MSERRKQNEFLKTMLHYECGRQDLEIWQARIHKAEGEEHCVASSLRLVFLIFLLSISGLGYCRLFLSTSMTHSPELLVKIFFALMVACGLCFFAFGGLWMYYRHLTNRVCAEGRQHLMSLAQSRSNFISLNEVDSKYRSTRHSSLEDHGCAGGLAEVA